MPRPRNTSTSQSTIIIDRLDEFKTFGIKLLMIVAVLAAIYFFSLIASILVTIVISGFLVLVFSPFLDSMNRYHISDAFGTVIIFLVLVSFFAFAGAMIVPLVAGELIPVADTISTNLSSALSGDITLPSYLSSFTSPEQYTAIVSLLQENAQSIFSALKTGLSTLSQGGLRLVLGVGNTIVNIAFIAVFTFFAALDRKRLARGARRVLPAQCTEYLGRKRDEIYTIIRAWIGGQSKLALIIFICIFVGLHLLTLFGIDIPNKFALAVIAGCMEFIPYIWTAIAFLPALLIALGVSTEAVIAIIILYVVVQQAENNILAPLVVGGSLDISAFFFLVAVSVGWSLGGIFGIFIALPVAAIIQSFVRDIPSFQPSDSSR